MLGNGEYGSVAKELPGQPIIEYTATIRESFLMGPGGGVKLRSV